LNIVANISEDAKALKYITPFGYTEGADIINSKEINVDYLIPGMVIMVVCIAISYIKYSKKDISA
jgi:ABC-2 type transport system permease protein